MRTEFLHPTRSSLSGLSVTSVWGRRSLGSPTAPRSPSLRSGVRLRGAPVDGITQWWVIATGRSVDFAASGQWLDGPVGSPDGIGDEWIGQHACRTGGQLVEDPDGGLVPDMQILQGPGFCVRDVHPAIIDFYEHTAGGGWTCGPGWHGGRSRVGVRSTRSSPGVSAS